MNSIRLSSIVCLFSVVAGCATSGSTDPRNDSLGTSIKCTFTADCDNYNQGRERDLQAERDEARRLEAESTIARGELAASEAELGSLQSSLDDLDRSIASLQKEADDAAAEAGEKKDEVAAIKAQLDAMRDEARDVESDVLKEDISVVQAEEKKTDLVNRRDELESLLETILSSQ